MNNSEVLVVATLRRHGNALTYFPTFVYTFEYVLESSKHRTSILPISILFRQREVTFQRQSTKFLDKPRTHENRDRYYTRYSRKVTIGFWNVNGWSENSLSEIHEF